MPSRRQQRVNARLIQEVSTIIRNLKDESLGFVTVTRSEVSPDMRNAKIFISVYGDEEKQLATLSKLDQATGFIRRELGKVMQMKVTPEIIFRRERYVAEADEMEKLIAEARSTDPNPGERIEEEEDSSDSEYDDGDYEEDEYDDEYDDEEDEDRY